MHGIGNDFILVDALGENAYETNAYDISKKVNHRKFGVGGDGLVLVLPSKLAAFKMRMFNPDGSEAEMCGNGIRCFAKYVHDKFLTPDVNIKVETLAGVKELKMSLKDGKKEGKVDSVRVDMGEPALKRSSIPMRGDEADQVVGETLKAEGEKFEITCVNMGNPHVVIFGDNISSVPVAKLGASIENHKSFPKRTNVHFVQIVNSSEIIIRTWERGAGETLACGTGACACVVASVLNGKTGRNVLVHLPGGDLRVEWAGNNRVLMTGPAEEVFEGEIDI